MDEGIQWNKMYITARQVDVRAISHLQLNPTGDEVPGKASRGTQSLPTSPVVAVSPLRSQTAKEQDRDRPCVLSAAAPTMKPTNSHIFLAHECSDARLSPTSFPFLPRRPSSEKPLCFFTALQYKAHPSVRLPYRHCPGGVESIRPPHATGLRGNPTEYVNS